MNAKKTDREQIIRREFEINAQKGKDAQHVMRQDFNSTDMKLQRRDVQHMMT